MEAIGLKKCAQIRCFCLFSTYIQCYEYQELGGLLSPASLTSALRVSSLFVKVSLTSEGYNCLSCLFNTFVRLSAFFSDVVAYLLSTLM